MKQLSLCLLLTFISINIYAQSICCAPMDSCHQINDSLNFERLMSLRFNGYASKHSDSAKSLKKGYLIHIWGQSNAGGQANNYLINNAPMNKIPYNFRLPFDRIWVQDHITGNWVTLQFAVNNKYQDTSAFGAEIGAAYRFKVAYKTDENLFIDKQFQDGRNIWYFTPSSSWYRIDVPYFKTLSNNWFTNNGWSITDKGILWQQGESDFHQSASWYKIRIDSIYNAAKTDAASLSWKFVISLIPRTSACFGAGVDSAFRQLKAQHSDVYLIGPIATPLKSDSIHLTEIAETSIGYKFIETLFNLESMSIYNNSQAIGSITSINGVPCPTGDCLLPSAGNGQLLAAQRYADSLVAAAISNKFLKDDSVRSFFGTLYCTRSNGVNTWALKNDGFYTFKGLKNTVVVNSGRFIDISLPDDVHTIRPLMSGADCNNTMNTYNTTSGTYQLSFNGFDLGAYIHEDRVRVSIGKAMELQLVITYDSINNTWAKWQPDPKPFNLSSSYAPTITYGREPNTQNLYVDISTQGVFQPSKLIEVTGSCSDVRDITFQITTSPITSDIVRLKIAYADGTPVRTIAPRDKMQLTIRWGGVYSYIDPSSYNFGNNAEIGVHGAYKAMN